MKRVFTSAALAVILTAAAGTAAADEAVILRADLSVEGDTIRLGDLFDISGDGADAVIARAPEPGRSLSLEPDYIRGRAAAAGYEWANPSGLLRVSVTRASQSLNAETISGAIEAELFARSGSPHEVRLGNSALVLHAPAGVAAGVDISSFTHDARSGLFSAEIRTHAGAEPTTVSGRAWATVDVPVLARPLRAGDVITEADIDWSPQRADRLRADAVTDPDNIIGLAARRSLRPGEPLRGYDLERPTAIERGEIVTLVLSRGGMQLSVQARSLGDVAEGESGRFVNLQSNRTVEARAEGPGLARIALNRAAGF